MTSKATITPKKRKSHLNMNYDAIVVGGNIVGAVTAITLVKAGLSVALIERNNIYNSDQDQNNHQGKNAKKATRLLALSKKTCTMLENLGIFDTIIQHAQPIKQIRITEHNSNAKLDFFPRDISLVDFGYMINEIDLLKSVYNYIHEFAFANSKKLKIFDNTTVSSIISAESSEIAYGKVTIQCTQKTEFEISASILIAADGKNSTIRKLAEIQTEERDYKQSGIVCDISHTKSHNGVAVEKFIPSGPFAILPKFGGYSSSLVWTEETERANTISRFDIQIIENLIKERIGDYLGEIKLISNPELFPLRLVNSDKYSCIKNRIAMVGDAAHSIHPVAGQGVNLGFRDIELLTKKIIQSYKLGLDCGSIDILNQYDKIRRSDSRLMIEATSIINVLFSNDIMLLKYLRTATIDLVDHFPVLQKIFTLYATGLAY